MQLRETVGISVETFRHWKRVLPPFSDRKKFTLGDVLAAGIISRLTDSCGVRAGFLSEISRAIVEACNAEGWASLQDKALVIDLQKQSCVLVSSAATYPFKETVVVCPLQEIITHIQGGLRRNEPVDEQHHLRFPPVVIKDARTQRRRA